MNRPRADVKKLTELFEEKAKSKPSPKVVKVPPRVAEGAGKALPADVRAAAEKAFGYDLSKVRILTLYQKVIEWGDGIYR